ncbi:hypothetical protein DFP72DRAFT_859706 [Ephemerocybe angulata]|uniref:Uncharacterized protein n=1 Tax=Ephemerocybe angulata TaxID=980116 RepID=A0A8H6HAM1_9AGAR|nr:hypothetical protein DFP72DRAFT_859706 [Tulosesus angulatus]
MDARRWPRWAWIWLLGLRLDLGLYRGSGTRRKGGRKDGNREGRDDHRRRVTDGLDREQTRELVEDNGSSVYMIRQTPKFNKIEARDKGIKERDADENQFRRASKGKSAGITRSWICQALERGVGERAYTFRRSLPLRFLAQGASQSKEKHGGVRIPGLEVAGRGSGLHEKGRERDRHARFGV